MTHLKLIKVFDIFQLYFLCCHGVDGRGWLELDPTCSRGCFESKCLFKCDRVLNLSRQYVHENGLTSWWTISICLCNPSLNANGAEHIWQWCGFRLSWIVLICRYWTLRNIGWCCKHRLVLNSVVKVSIRGLYVKATEHVHNRWDVHVCWDLQLKNK